MLFRIRCTCMPHAHILDIKGADRMLWENTTKNYARKMEKRKPEAFAQIKGGPDNQKIDGTVAFYKTLRGVLVIVDIAGLPVDSTECAENIFAMHIHQGGSCTGNAQDPFADTKSHYNPKNCPHPAHAGDLPPLFANNGSAWCAFVTNRFRIRDILGHTVVIHSKADDFKTQPSGDSGNKLACGVIRL